jgi:hypothetical protein
LYTHYVYSFLDTIIYVTSLAQVFFYKGVDHGDVVKGKGKGYGKGNYAIILSSCLNEK